MEKRFYIKRTNNDQVEYFESFDEAQKAFLQLVDECSKQASLESITLYRLMQSCNFRGYIPRMKFNKRN